MACHTPTKQRETANFILIIQKTLRFYDRQITLSPSTDILDISFNKLIIKKVYYKLIIKKVYHRLCINQTQ